MAKDSPPAPGWITLTDQQAPDLNQIFKELTGGTGLSVEGVYRMDLSAETNKANAMLAGLVMERQLPDFQEWHVADPGPTCRTGY